MKTKMPTEKIIAKLSPLYTKFYEGWGTRKGGDIKFQSLLDSEYPSLVPYYRYLIQNFSTGRMWKKVLIGKSAFQYKCQLCGNSMCGTKAICSDNFLESTISKNPDWSLNEIKRSSSGSSIAKLNVSCNHCSTTKDLHLHYFLLGYSCGCSKGAKVSSTLQAKYGHSRYLAHLKAKGVRVKLLTRYVNQSTYVKFKLP